MSTTDHHSTIIRIPANADDVYWSGIATIRCKTTSVHDGIQALYVRQVNEIDLSNQAF